MWTNDPSHSRTKIRKRAASRSGLMLQCCSTRRLRPPCPLSDEGIGIQSPFWRLLFAAAEPVLVLPIQRVCGSECFGLQQESTRVAALQWGGTSGDTGRVWLPSQGKPLRTEERGGGK